MTTLGSGSLLVAAPMLEDSNFRRTVVLMLEAGADGALGVVLNRPSESPVADALPRWQHAVVAPEVVFVGGPVQLDGVLGVGLAPEDGGKAVGLTPVAGRIGVVDLRRPAEDLVITSAGVRLMAGHAGWGPGQLESEIDEGAWFVVDADPAFVLDPDPATLWRRVLAAQPGNLALMATFPEDPSLN